jgi:hypothetical protein
VPLLQVVRRARAAHPGCHPAWRYGIAQHLRPAARDSEGQHGIVQLALGVRRRSVPPPLAPEDVVEVGIGMLVHAGAQIDQALRPLDQGRQDVGGERVDGEDLRQPIEGKAMRLLVADSGVVDDGVETAERVDLRRHVLGGGDGLHVSGDHRLGPRQRPPRIVRSLSIARMQNHAMSLLDQQLSGHQAESGR